MHREKITEMLRTCRSCIEKCIVSSHRPLDWSGSSFFKVMEPNSSFCLGIPTDFGKRMQYGECKDAILQGPSGHLWHVNLCCADTRASLADGWESFVSDQFIEVGDILVFRHVEDVHFSVQVFGPSGCEKQSTFYFQNYTSCCFREINLNLSTICNMKRCKHRQNSTTASVSLLIDRKPNRNGDSEVKDLKIVQNETALDCSMEFLNSSEIKATDIMMAPMGKPCICENKASLCKKSHSAICACTDVAPVGEDKVSLPHLTLPGINSGQSNSLRNLPEFSVVLPKTAARYRYLITVPQVFVKSWMSRVKLKRSIQVTLLYGKKPKSWKVTFTTYKGPFGHRSQLCYGWKAFSISNGLQEGDRCAFKLVNEVEYIFNVLVTRHGFHEDYGGGQRKRNVTCAHPLVSHKKMKTSVLNPNPYLEVIHEESSTPHSMVENKSGVGYGSHNPVEVTCIEEPKGKTKIEVIELD